MKTHALREYRRLRAAGWQASAALFQAKTRAEFEALGDDVVRLRIEPDDVCDMDDLKGDCFNPRVNDNIPRSRLEREERAFEEKVQRDGVVGVIGEYFDAHAETWIVTDSCWGFVGDDWRDSGYDADIMHATMRARLEADQLFENGLCI